MVKKSLKNIKKIVNQIGQTYLGDLKFRFIKIVRIHKKHKKYKITRIFVVIKNKNGTLKQTEFYLLKQGQNPFKSNRIPVHIKKKKVNLIGKKQKNKYQRFYFESEKNISGYSWITVINKISKEKKTVSWNSLQQGSNPFNIRNSKSWIPELKAKTNSLGNKQTKFLKYKFHSFVSIRANHYDFYIKIKNIESGDILKVLFFSLKKGHNPWRKTLTTPHLKNLVNKRGLKQRKNEKFIFKKIFKRKTLHIVIESIKTKQTKVVRFTDILKGFPFRTNKVRKEDKIITPKIIKLLKENNVKIISKHKQVISKVKPDIVCKIKNKIYIIEVKDDDKMWSKRHITEQIKKYNKAGFQTFPNFKEAILISPNGRYGLSIADFKKKYLS